MRRRPPRSTQSRSSAASDVYKRQEMADLGTWARPEGGFFVGVTLNKSVKAEALIAKGLEKGIQLTNGRDFFADGRGDTFVRLPFCALTTEEIDEGVRTLAQVVRSL